MTSRLLINSVRLNITIRVRNPARKSNRNFLRAMATNTTSEKSSEAPWAIGALAILGAGFYLLMTPSLHSDAKHPHSISNEKTKETQLDHGAKHLKEAIKEKTAAVSNQVSTLKEKGSELFDRANTDNDLSPLAQDHHDKAKKELTHMANETFESAGEEANKLAKESANIYEDAKKHATELFGSAEHTTKKESPGKKGVPGLSQKSSLDATIDIIEPVMEKDNAKTVKDLATHAEAKALAYKEEAIKYIPDSVDDIEKMVTSVLDALPPKEEVESKVNEVNDAVKTQVEGISETVKQKTSQLAEKVTNPSTK